MNVRKGAVKSDPVKARLDAGRHWRAKLGFVVLAMEQTVEDDVWAMTPPGVGIHFSRIPMSNHATVETLGAMAPDITASADLLLPDDRLDAICYTCNSGTMVIGEEGVNAALARAKPEARPTTVMTGVVRGLHALGARRIVVATPYLDEVNDYVLAFLSDHGFEVLEIQGLNLRTNTEIDFVDPEFMREYARGLDRPGRRRGVHLLRGAADAGRRRRAGSRRRQAGGGQQPGHDVGLPAAGGNRGRDSGLRPSAGARLRSASLGRGARVPRAAGRLSVRREEE